jgi:hypothetical protein
MQRAIPGDLRDVMIYMSVDHNEGIDAFKERKSFNEYSPSDAWTNVFGPIIDNSICGHFQFVMFYHLALSCPFVLGLFFGVAKSNSCNVYGFLKLWMVGL